MFPESNIKIKTRLKPISGAIELTPLIDVLFLLLIFFILSSSFIQVWGISVQVPQTEHRSTWGVGKFVVSMQEDGSLYFNDHPINIEGLKRNFQTLRNQNVASVILRADAKTDFEKVLEIISLASTYEMTTILSTSNTEKKPIETSPESNNAKE